MRVSYFDPDQRAREKEKSRQKDEGAHTWRYNQDRLSAPETRSLLFGRLLGSITRWTFGR